MRHLINYGTMGAISGNRGGTSANIPMLVTNYGRMSGIETNWGNADITIDNYGIIDMTTSKHHLSAGNNYSFILKNYAMIIIQNADIFNNFDGNQTEGDNSHLIFNSSNRYISFADSSGKIILDFGGDFEFDKEYLISKLVTDKNGSNRLQVDFGRLTTRSDIFTLIQNGDNFIVKLNVSSGAIGNLYKSNIRTMNNFYTMSNAMIYSHKYSAKRTTNKRRVIRRVKKTANLFNDSSLQDSALAESWQSTLDSLESNESFAYKSDSGDYYANNATTNPTQTRRTITTNRTLSNQSDKYYFILTPFVNHNLFFESGRYNLSGLEYGFLTAFSGKITPSNALGAHFMMSYGSLGDSKDKDFSITNLNLNIGLNYKFDMIWDMYLKTRGDFFYFLNQVKTLTMPNAIKPNTLGFGVSVAYGKDFNFGSGGMLGVEVAIDYKALQSSTISLQNSADRSVSETYQKSLYNLIYVDLGLNYAKYFNTNAGIWGLNAGLGIKGNVSANKLAKSQIRISALNRSVDMVLDNDKVLGYANLSGSYVLNAKDFDMEFSIAYYGNYGDRVISNGGGVEMRVVF